MMRLSALAAVVLVFLTPQALSPQNNQGAPTQIGDFNFNLPAGWRRTQNAVLTAPGTAPGRVTVIMLSTSPLQSDLKTTYGNQLAELQKSFRVQASEPVPRQLPGGYPALSATAILSDSRGAQLAALYVLAQSGNRAEGILFISNDSNALATHKAALETVLVSLRFSAADPGSTPLPSSPDPGAAFSLPPGIVPPDRDNSASAASGGPLLSRLSTTPGGPLRFSAIFRAPAKKAEDPTSNLAIADPAANSPSFKFLVFFSDGRVKRGLIQSGFDQTIQESSMRLDISSGGKFATQWGMYQLAGGRGRMQFASASGGQQLVSGLRGEIYNVVEYLDHLEVGGETYLLLDCPNALRLNGTYKPFGDAKQAGIRFTPDGQFIDQGILDTHTGMAIGLVGGGVGIAYGFSSPKAGRGIYNISNYGLHLHYANSVAPSPVFFIEPGNSPNDVRVLYIANVKYQRIEGQ